jgi:hypothetical protein
LRAALFVLYEGIIEQAVIGLNANKRQENGFTVFRWGYINRQEKATGSILRPCERMNNEWDITYYIQREVSERKINGLVWHIRWPDTVRCRRPGGLQKVSVNPDTEFRFGKNCK